MSAQNMKTLFMLGLMFGFFATVLWVSFSIINPAFDGINEALGSANAQQFEDLWYGESSNTQTDQSTGLFN